MKKYPLPLAAVFTLAFAASAAVGAPPKKEKDAPTPVTVNPSPATASPTIYNFEQKTLSGFPVLVAPDQAQAIISKFREAYEKMGKPRLLLYVNRELVDEQSGLQLNSYTQKKTYNKTTVDSTVTPIANQNQGNPAVNIRAGGSVTLSGNGSVPGQLLQGPGKIRTNREQGSQEKQYVNRSRPLQKLEDKQTMRDVERLFGRPLRMGGAHVADQRIATQLLANRSLDQILKDTNSESARKDREALGKITDVAVEVLVSSRQIVVQEVSGAKVYQAPDIQVTAVQLKDARIIGQASSADIIGKDRYAGRVVSQFDVREITEAVALALMEDMTLGVK